MRAKSMTTLFFIFVILLMLTTVVYAEPQITVPDGDLNTGDEFEMGIDTGEKLQNVEFTLQYDKNIFEYISSSTLNVDITETSNGLLIVPQDSSELKRYSVMLKLKVITTKDRTANVLLECRGTTENGGTTVLTGMRGLNIGGGNASSTTDTDTPYSSTTTTPKYNSTVITPTPKVTTTSIPKTGVEDKYLPVIAVGLAVCAIVSFTLYRKNNI